MSPFDLILTHPGGAHKDEFLACSLLLATQPVAIVRREPTPADLADARTCVVDVGHAHEPALNNFDHHQLPKDYPPTCALSLVLRHLGLYEDAREFCDWLESAEWFDCRGPIGTAHWLGIDPEVLNKLHSPIDGTLLRRFSLGSRLEPNDPLWLMMRLIGEDLLTYLKTLRARLDFLDRHAVIWELPINGVSVSVVFVPRTDPLPEEPSFVLDRFILRRGLADKIVATVSPDRRSTGYGLSRFRDNPRMDFTRISNAPDVHFAHARGFIAKTTASEIPRLQELLMRAGTP